MPPSMPQIRHRPRRRSIGCPASSGPRSCRSGFGTIGADQDPGSFSSSTRVRKSAASLDYENQESAGLRRPLHKAAPHQISKMGGSFCSSSIHTVLARNPRPNSTATLAQARKAEIGFVLPDSEGRRAWLSSARTGVLNLLLQFGITASAVAMESSEPPDRALQVCVRRLL